MDKMYGWALSHLWDDLCLQNHQSHQYACHVVKQSISCMLLHIGENSGSIYLTHRCTSWHADQHPTLYCTAKMQKSVIFAKGGFRIGATKG